MWASVRILLNSSLNKWLPFVLTDCLEIIPAKSMLAKLLTD